MTKVVSMLPWTDEKGLSKNYPRIYHYTSFHNLRSILKSGGLFASPFTETNDREEFRFAASFLLPLIEGHTRSHWLKNRNDFLVSIKNAGEDPDEILRHESASFYEAGLKTWGHPFLTCFSKHQKKHQLENGLLTMWRSYCREDGGIALGFDTKKLIERTHIICNKYKVATLPIIEVLYGDQKTKIQERLNESIDLISAYSEIADAAIEAREPLIAEDAILKLIILQTGTKHPDFSDEREIRMVLLRSPHEIDDRLEVPKNGSRVLLNVCDCLSHILIGPSRDQAAIEAAVTHAIDDCGRSDDIFITRSKTPYRSI